MSFNLRLAALERQSDENEMLQPSSWLYLELPEDENLNEEQRETLKRNNAIDDASCGFRYIEAKARGKRDVDASFVSAEFQ